jgi:hypothetical protein
MADIRRALCLAAVVSGLIVSDVGAAPPPVPLTLSDALQSQLGEWSGSLEYRDYSADRWFGLPVKVSIRDGGDGVTQVRVADFDDGPKVGIVRITTISMIGEDRKTEYSSSFRKGQMPEVSSTRLTLTRATDAAHWTIISESEDRDDDRPARIRVTLTRDGDRMTSLKEVDFSDDKSESWLQRNRQTLTRIGN